MDLKSLPTVNAVLNGASAVLLAAGYLFIRKKNIEAHKRCMLAAVATSTLFLTSYLYYHAHAGVTRFARAGWIRPAYFSILLSHTVLAALIVPFILVTLFRAWRNDFGRHIRIARWTLPMWAYVSVTGVVIYWILYHTA